MNLPNEAQPKGLIADLSYRGYEGPLLTRRLRWWVITRNEIKLVFRNVWLLGLLVVFAYLIPGVQLYMRSFIPPEIIGERPFASYFYSGYSGSLFWLFLVTLLIGASSISRDNRANALQILLAKPITKLDYLIGKLAAVFFILFGMSLIPALALYLFCLGTFYDQGFSKEAFGILVRITAASLLPAVVHSSVAVGVSARSKSPTIATAVYGALYIVLSIVSQIASNIVVARSGQEVAATIMHLSISGVLSGIGQHIYNAQPSFLGQPLRIWGEPLPRPELLPMVAVAAALCALGIMLAASHIQAVEVVRD
ncbi:MAG: ABC transporter permease [Armatimonadota bacterium]